MGNFYDTLKTTTGGDRTALPPSEPKRPYRDLKIVKALTDKVLDSGATRHTLLVGSESVNGTAFLKIDLYPYTLHPAAIALAFKAEEAAISSGETTAADIDALRAKFQEDGLRKAKLAAGDNDDETALTENALAKTENILTGIRINVGNIINLQKNAKQTVDPASWTPESSVGTVFTGNVKAGLNESSEVGGVYAPSTPKAATTATPTKVTELATA
jgi:hypothetical protein